MTRSDAITRLTEKNEAEAREAIRLIEELKVRFSVERRYSNTRNAIVRDVLDALDDTLSTQAVYAKRALETAASDAADSVNEREE